MTVMAKHWVKCDGVWRKKGECFDVENIEPLRDCVIELGEHPAVEAEPDMPAGADNPVLSAEPAPSGAEQPKEEKPKPKRGRPKKSEKTE